MQSAVSILALAALVSALAYPALASGTSGSGYGGGGGSYNFAPRDPEAEAYSRGKSMVSRRIACKKCAYPDGVKDASTAQEVVTRVQSGEFDLKPEQREQVLFYLSRRFAQ